MEIRPGKLDGDYKIVLIESPNDRMKIIAVIKVTTSHFSTESRTLFELWREEKLISSADKIKLMIKEWNFWATAKYPLPSTEIKMPKGQSICYECKLVDRCMRFLRHHTEHIRECKSFTSK